MKKPIALSLLLILALLSFAACQSPAESRFELQSSIMKPSGSAMEIVIETAMSQEMLESIDMSKYSLKDTALTIKFQDADGKDIAVTDQNNQIKEDFSITSDGKILKSFSVITTLKISNEMEQYVLTSPTSLLFCDIKIADKKYKNSTVQLPEDAFMPKVLKPGDYTANLNYTDELGSEGTIAIAFTASPDGSAISNVVIDTTKVVVQFDEDYTNADIENLKKAAVMVKSEFQVVFNTNGASGTDDLSLEFNLEDGYFVKDGVLTIDNMFLSVTGNVDSQGHVQGIGEFIFRYQGKMKKFGLVEFTASPK